MSITEGCDGQSRGIITFKIDNFSQSTKQTLSPPQSICGLQCRILFDVVEGYPSIYLRCTPESDKTTSWCCYAQAELILVSQKDGTKNLSKEFYKCLHSKLSGWGFKKFGSFNRFTDPTLGYIKNGTIILQANILIHAVHAQSAVLNLPTSQVPADPSRQLTLGVTSRAGQENAYKVSSRMNELRKAQILCDVNIVVNDRVFPCHRNVLAAACDYFKAMFTHDFVESGQKDVTLQNIEPEIFEQILDFIYTGKICIDYDNVLPMHQISDYLGLPYIEDLCYAYFENDVPSEDIDKLYSFDVRSRRQHTLYHVMKRLVENYFDYLVPDTLLNFPPDVLKEILTPKCVKSNTNAVLNFLRAWVKKTGDTQWVIELLTSVDGTLSMDATCLRQLINGMMEVEDTNQTK